MKKYTSNSLYYPEEKDFEGFAEYVDYSLKKSFVDPIFSELEKGEKIISMKKIPERMIPELH